MIAQIVELRCHRPSLRQVPHIHKPASGHQQDERPVRGPGIRGREPYQIHTPAFLIRLALFFTVQRIIPVSRIRHGVQLFKTLSDVARKVLFQLCQGFVPEGFL